MSGGASTSSPGQCSDSTYELDAGFRVEGAFEYIFLAEKTPSGLNVANTETAVKESVTNWTKAKNDCGMTDDIGVTSSYLGRASGSVEINTDGSCKATGDGKSETGFGDLPSSLVAVACVWFEYRPKQPYPVASADVRLNKAKKWWNTLSSCTGSRYIVEAVLTHERGHVFGLTHGKKVTESAHKNLTMSPNVNGYCEDAETTLGKGDILGMRELGY